MHRGVGGIVFDPVDTKQDKEVTLGPMALATLALGLCALCAIFFLWGYSVGHSSPGETVAVKAPAGGPSAGQVLGGQPKPVASQNEPTPDAAQQAAAPENTAPAEASTSSGVAAVAPSSSSVNSEAPPASSGAVVQTALPAQPAPAQPIPAGGQVQPALRQGTAWMVQIAAVSQQEDADVLVGALRKHGYAVSAQRDPTDNLLHVQVGPFATHADAASMRQRLLNDGYNAIIEP